MTAGVESFFTDWEVTLVVLTQMVLAAFIGWVLIKYINQSFVRIWESGPKHSHFATSYGCPVCDMLLNRSLHGRWPADGILTRKGLDVLRSERDKVRAELQEHWEQFHGGGRKEGA